MLELVVKCFCVVCEPSLYCFEQVCREVVLVATGLSVFCDVIETLKQELFVLFCADGECSLFEPFGGPCDCVE